jgi:hypothetical protein
MPRSSSEHVSRSGILKWATVGGSLESPSEIIFGFGIFFTVAPASLHLEGWHGMHKVK